MSTLLLVVLVLLLLGALPLYPYSTSFGLIVIVLIIALLTGRL